MIDLLIFDSGLSINSPPFIFIKVLRDNTKSRREVELHWRASRCKHIVPVIDVYENVIKSDKCLFVIMEW